MYYSIHYFFSVLARLQELTETVKDLKKEVSELKLELRSRPAPVPTPAKAPAKSTIEVGQLRLPEGLVMPAQTMEQLETLEECLGNEDTRLQLVSIYPHFHQINVRNPCY